MANESGISWTDATWNPWQGCTKISPACKNCYMFREKHRYGQDPEVVVRSKPPTFNLPIATGKRAIPPGSLVFTCSWSDWFHSSADEWRDEAWAIIRRRPDCLFLILTKRAERIADHLPDDWGDGYSNVALGVTVEDQRRADERIGRLLAVPAVVRFLSCEPLISPVQLGIQVGGRFEFFDHGLGDRAGRIDWVIVGGESGPGARPMNPAWARDLRDQALAAGVAFHFKQWGEHDADGQRVGVERAGRLLDGEVHDDRPAWSAPTCGEVAP